jgi:xylulose-5-phosphate/fructose-6-phosphate phosphoketolase
MPDRDFDALLTPNKPVIFNFHAYPWMIHRLTYHRQNHENLHVHGYKEKGSINTPLELAIRNQIDRFSIAVDVIDRVPKLTGHRCAHQREIAKRTNLLSQQCSDPDTEAILFRLVSTANLLLNVRYNFYLSG